MKTIKWLFLSLFSLLLIAIAVAAYLLVGIDPNAYKPELETLARNNGIELQIHGDIGWSLFPSLAIRIGETELSGKDKGIPTTHFQQADFTLDWKALINRQISFRAIAIDGADIQIESSDEATNLAALPGAAASTQQTKTDMPFQLAIDSLTLTNSRITLVDPAGQQQTIDNLNFSSHSLNLEAKPFPIELSFTSVLPNKSVATTVTLEAEISLNLDQQKFRFDNVTLKLSEPELSLAFDAIYDGDSDSVTLSSLEGKLQSGQFSGALVAHNVQTEPSVEGSIAITNIVLRDWLETPPEGIERLSFSSSFSASNKAVKLDNYKLSLDDFSGSGSLSLSLQQPRQLSLTLNGNQLNLQPQGTENSGGSAALLTPLLAPLALLEGGKGHIEVNLERLSSGDIQVEKLHFNLFANGKVLQLADLSGDIFGGQFQTSARVDMRGDTPALEFTSQLNHIDLQQALSEQNDLSGTLDFAFTGNSHGDNAETLQQNLNGDGTFTVIQPRINNLNLERSYCELAAMIEKTAQPNQAWPNYTQLSDLHGTLQLRNQTITLPSYTTALGNLAINGNGSINLMEQLYDMLITVNLQGDRTSENGCIVKSKSIRNRDIPLRCRGSFADQGDSSCKPDKSFITRILQERLMKNLFNMPDEEAAEKPQGETTEETDIEQEPEPDLEDQLKQKAVDALLRGIFN